MATLGLRNTVSADDPQAAASAISAPPIGVPSGSTTSPTRASLPRRTTFSPLCKCALPQPSDRSSGPLHMLHHHDSVGALRHWRAGHNLNRSARLQRTTLPLFTRPNLPRNFQETVTEICGAHGKSVASRPVERRLIPVGMNRLRQHATFRLQQRNQLRRRRRQIGCMRQHDLSASSKPTTTPTSPAASLLISLS